MERGNGFGPIGLQSRLENRYHARLGRRLCAWRNCAEIPTESKTAGALARRMARQGRGAFPGIGRRGAASPALDDARRIAELERKIGQLTMENDFLKKALQHFKDHHPPAVISGADVCLKKSSKPQRKAQP